MAFPALIEAMLQPGFYPHRPQRVELRQTHISYVFLVGEDVYKVKKPVRFTFLDFTTLERRRHFCREEVRLNRRLAPDVYLEVLAVRPDGDGFCFTAEDDPSAVEYVVHMRRLPDDRTLARLLPQNKVTADDIDRIAALLVDFHRRADASDEVNANGTPAAIQRVLQDNYEGTAPFHGVTISAGDDEAIQSFARDFLRENDALFHQRQAEKRIRDGHADLHADHVYLVEPPVIVDCVEFNSAFRWCDVASDLSFLAMDLDSYGRPDLRARLIERYVALSGDRDLLRLVPFYSCYRAYVRGKVDSLRSAEEEIGEGEREHARARARERFALAYRYTWAYSPALVVIAGLSGSGKSILAQRFVERTGFILLSSDMLRKELAGLKPTTRVTAAEQTELYSPAMSRRTYEELFARGANELSEGRGVVLDATFQLRESRDRAKRLAASAHVPFLLVECRCSDDVIRKRLKQRARRNDNASDADWAVYLEQKKRAEPILSSEHALVLDTDADATPLAAIVEHELRKRACTE